MASSLERYNRRMKHALLLLIFIGCAFGQSATKVPFCKGAAIPILIQDGATPLLGGAIGFTCATLPAGWTLNMNTTPWSFSVVPVNPPGTTGVQVLGGPCTPPGTNPPSIAIYAQDPASGVCFPIITVADPGFVAAVPEISPLNWMNPSRVASVTDPPNIVRNQYGQIIPQNTVFNAYGQPVAQPVIWPQRFYWGDTLTFSHP